MAFGIVECGDQAQCVTVFRTSFDPESALPYGGEHNFRRKNLRYVFPSSQPIYAGSRKNNRFKLARCKFLQPRIYITAQVEELKIRAVMAKLRLSPKAASANSRAGH